MIALYYNNIARAQMGFRYGLFAFTAAVLGGIGNLNGRRIGRIPDRAHLGAAAMGIVKEYIPGWGAQWTPTVIFGVLVITMIFRPSGLLGEQTAEKV